MVDSKVKWSPKEDLSQWLEISKVGNLLTKANIKQIELG